MCICLNCRRLYECTIYFLIEEKHQEPHFAIHRPSYKPASPIVEINQLTKKSKVNLEWDLVECLSFEEEPGNWLINKILHIDFTDIRYQNLLKKLPYKQGSENALTTTLSHFHLHHVYL